MFTIEQFKEKKEAIIKQQQELKAQVTDVFSKGVKELFDKYPNHLAQIFWNQYTPYFNDGDPCQFSVNNFYINGEEAYDYGRDPIDDLYTPEEIKLRDEYAGYTNFFTCLSDERVQEFKLVEHEVCAFLALFDEDDYEFMFGDHSEITITKKGISVRHYDHD